jgi:glucosamine-6-phosphate deaminase
VKLVRLPAGDAWAAHLADVLIARLQQQPTLRVCLPTGLTPVPLYDRVRAAVQRGTVSFRHADVLLLDEFGGVPADDPGRCDRMLQRVLLDHVDLPPVAFHRLPIEQDVEQACRDHEVAVGAGCDLTILGVGGNGHIGMNEPGSSPTSVTRRVTLAPETTAASARYFRRDHDLPTWGVTMGIGTILRSREIWVLATGTGKAGIVRDVLHGSIGTDVPASLLRAHPHAWLFADDAAAALVTAEQPSEP